MSTAKELDLAFFNGLPKAELHLHIEGTLEPELIFDIAKRNGVEITKYKSVEELREAYKFTDLQSFLDIYYQGTDVLLKEQDFYDMTWAYVERAHKNGVKHAEIFFDPQSHTARVPIADVINGINRALVDARNKYNFSSQMILCFLRHLSGAEAVETLKSAIPHISVIKAVGLDSAEVGNPPEKFTEAFKLAEQHNLRTVAHAGEEGPPEYVWNALNILKVSRIDHGVRSLEDETLIQHLVKNKIPLTVCPLSNLKLQVVKSLTDHPLKRLLDKGVVATVNSDDPAYFGGYVGDNFYQCYKSLNLSTDDIYTLAKNSFLASFITEEERASFIKQLDDYFALHSIPIPKN